MLLDSDQKIVTQANKRADFRRCVVSQIREQKWNLQGPHVGRIGAELSIYYVVIDKVNGQTNDIEHLPKIYYFITEIKPDTCIRLNYDQPYFLKDYRYRDRINRIRGNKDLVCGEKVMEEIIEEVFERFENVIKQYDVDKVFVPEHAPIKAA